MKHIVGFYSHGKPKLVVRERKNPETIELELSGKLGLELSHNRYCIGYTRFETDYLCPNESLADYGQCPQCRRMELSCASCRGDECLYGHSECALGGHYIYLASFGEIVKAGVTRKERITERLVEQGADFGAVVAEAKDGFEARAVEALLQRQFSLRNAVKTTEKLRLLGFDREKGRGAIGRALTELSGFPGISVREVLDLSSFYPSLEEKPILHEKLDGEVLGAKGNLLFLRRDGLRAVNMKGIIGKYITRQ